LGIQSEVMKEAVELDAALDGSGGGTLAPPLNFCLHRVRRPWAERAAQHGRRVSNIAAL